MYAFAATGQLVVLLVLRATEITRHKGAVEPGPAWRVPKRPGGMPRMLADSGGFIRYSEMEMKVPLFLALALLPTLVSGETEVTPMIDSVGLFKNGLAIVRVSFPITGPGQYQWNHVPRIAHGSLWVESDGSVAIRSTTRMVEVAAGAEASTGNLQQDLAGKKVSVTLKADAAGGAGVSLEGEVWRLPAPASSRSWNAEYSSLDPNTGSYYWHRRSLAGTQLPPAAPGTGNFLVLQEGAGRRYIDQSTIASLRVNGPFDSAAPVEEQPVLIFDVREAPADGGAIRITYLTRGLAWLPSYRLDLTDPAVLEIRQNAVVRNEMGDIKETEVQLISGFPNVRFGNVDSPVWPGTGLSAFFQQVNQSGSVAQGVLGNAIVSQQLVYMNLPSQGDFAALPEAAEQGNASDDIHYESIGRQTMKAGDTLSLDVAAARTKYERVVEWIVPDGRDDRGRHQEGSADGSDAWDAVRFVNPFAFPMTTAAATVIEAGDFRGQSLSGWVNPGQQTSLRITRALSVRTQASEVEEEAQREVVIIGGRNFQRTSVKGRLVVQNFRGEAVDLAIRCEFSGELLEAEGEPGKTLRTDGKSRVNPRRQLDWTFSLPAGGEKIIHYRYQVLVDR